MTLLKRLPVLSDDDDDDVCLYPIFFSQLFLMESIVEVLFVRVRVRVSDL
jgi:Na+/H+-translocating membrane pyrophosphatase